MKNQSNSSRKNNIKFLLIGIFFLLSGIILLLISENIASKFSKWEISFIIKGLVILISFIVTLIGLSLSFKYAYKLKSKSIVIGINIYRLIFGLLTSVSAFFSTVISIESEFNLFIAFSLMFLTIALVITIKSIVLFFKKNLGIDTQNTGDNIEGLIEKYNF